jgi:hypothetical protein
MNKYRGMRWLRLQTRGGEGESGQISGMKTWRNKTFLEELVTFFPFIWHDGIEKEKTTCTKTHRQQVDHIDLETEIWRGYTDRQIGDLISLFLFSQNKDSRLKTDWKIWALDGRVILKWVLGNNMWVWIGFFWPGIGTSGRF